MQAKRAILLTGTPALSRPIELFNLLNWYSVYLLYWYKSTNFDAFFKSLLPTLLPIEFFNLSSTGMISNLLNWYAQP
jgi:hypothetical protein